jgi:hypothetical protein
MLEHGSARHNRAIFCIDRIPVTAKYVGSSAIFFWSKAELDSFDYWDKVAELAKIQKRREEMMLDTTLNARVQV